MSEPTTWHELYSPDLEASARFYNTLFGWTTTAMDMGEMGQYHMFESSGEAHSGMMSTNDPMFEGRSIPPHWLTYFRVVNIDDCLGKVKENGGEVLQDKVEIPGTGYVAICRDPQGAVFAVHQPAS